MAVYVGNLSKDMLENTPLTPTHMYIGVLGCIKSVQGRY